MNLNLVFEILEIASTLVNTRNAASGIRDSDVAAALLAIILKGAQAIRSTPEKRSILLAVERMNPNQLTSAFGKASARLLEILHAGRAGQEQWANSITEGASIREPWRSGFGRLGSESIVEEQQRERARSAYFVPAVRTADAFHLKTERGLALAFDIHVQNGGISGASRTAKSPNEPRTNPHAAPS